MLTGSTPLLLTRFDLAVGWQRFAHVDPLHLSKLITFIFVIDLRLQLETLHQGNKKYSGASLTV